MAPSSHIDPSPLDVINDRVSIQPMSGRNQVVAVWSTSGGAVHKRHARSHDADRERRMLEHMRQPESALARHVPPLIGDSSDDCLITTSVVGTGQTLQDTGLHALHDGRTAEVLGRLLANVHTTTPPDWAAGSATIPLLHLWRPNLALWRSLSLANRAAYRLIQGSNRFEGPLRELDESSTAQHLVHGDVRLANVVVGVGHGDVWLVDWESAGRGDPDLDLGSLMADILTQWAVASPGSDSRQTNRRRPPTLGTCQAFAAGILTAYGHKATVPPERTRLAMATGAHLIISALSLGDRSSVLSRQQVNLLQLAEHCLNRPGEIAGNLLGI